jgi:putative membrane protein
MSCKPTKYAIAFNDWLLLAFHTLLCFIMLSCSNETSYQDALQGNEDRIEDATRLDDAKFLVEEKSLNILQRKLIDLASSSGYSAAVVDFGKAHVTFFNDIGKDIDRIAKDESFELPTEMSIDHQATFSQIENSTRALFDQQLISTLKEINSSQKRTYISKASEASDPDVRAFAARKIGSIRSLEQSIIEVEKGLLPVDHSK